MMTKIKNIYELNNRGELLIFPNKANCYKLNIQDINDCKPSEWGEFFAYYVIWKPMKVSCLSVLPTTIRGDSPSPSPNGKNC